MTKLLSTLLLVLTIAFSSTFAQTGTIQGKLVRQTDNQPIYGAEVFIPNTIFAAYSEEDGTFLIEDVDPGTYTIHVEDYEKGDTAIYSGVIVKPGEITEVEIIVKPTYVQDEALIILVHVDHGTETQAIDDIKKSNKVENKTTIEEAKKKGDSNVGQQTSRVSGVTLEGGKYVYVRGLSDRYSKTLLNGSEIPGLDPNRNSVQLDMFPTNFVQSVSVIKTYSPDLPGDFTGGLVDIKLQEYPDSLFVKFSGSMAYNPQVHFRNDYLGYSRGKTDWLGFDNGNRDIPDIAQKALDAGGIPGFSDALFNDTKAQQLEDINESFNKEIRPGDQSSFMDYSSTLTIGNLIHIQRKDTNKLDRKLGYFAGANYRRSYSFYEDYRVGLFSLTGTVDERTDLDPIRDLSGTRGSETASLGGFLSTTYLFNKKHKVGINALRNQSGTSSSAFVQGFSDDEPDATLRNSRMGYLERAITSFQLHGEHKFDTLLFMKKQKMELNYISALTFSKQDEPDIRWYNDDYQVIGGVDEYDINAAAYRVPARFWRYMKETNIDNKVNFIVSSFKDREEDTLKYRIKIGGSMVQKSRDFSEVRLEYISGGNEFMGGAYDGTYNTFNADENLGWVGNPGSGANQFGFWLDDDFTTPTNNYIADQTVIGAYAMIEKPISNKLDFVGGARFEKTNIELTSENPSLPVGVLDNADILPSINFIYKIHDGKTYYGLDSLGNVDSNKVDRIQDMKLRFSATRTLARPNFREIAPFTVERYDLNVLEKGNPLLERSLIDNFDIRWEIYPRKNELITVGAFFKSFINPIQKIILPQASSTEMTWENIEGKNGSGRAATLYGLEFEFRKGLEFITPKLDNFRLATNLTLARSAVQIKQEELDAMRNQDPYHPDTRPLFGSSPYIANASLEYNTDEKNDSTAISANLTLNVFGKRISIVNRAGTPPIYEMPRPTLDFNIGRDFGDRLNIKLRVQNILNPTWKWKYIFVGDNAVYDKFDKDQEFLLNSFKLGRRFSLSVSYNFK